MASGDGAASRSATPLVDVTDQRKADRIAVLEPTVTRQAHHGHGEQLDVVDTAALVSAKSAS